MAAHFSRQFLCQKCKQPLVIDESLQDINSAAFDLLLGPLSEQHTSSVTTTAGALNSSTQPHSHPAAIINSAQSHDSNLNQRSSLATNDTIRSEATSLRIIPPLNQASGARTLQEHGRPSVDASESFVMLPKSQPSSDPRAAIPPLSNYPAGSKTGGTNASANGGGSLQGSSNGSRQKSVGYNGTGSNGGTGTGTGAGAGGSGGGGGGGASGNNELLDQSNNRTAKANRLRTTGKLYDLMSEKSDVDHPLCQECADMLLDALAKQLRDVSRERDCYIEFLRTVNSNVVSDAEMEALENDIKAIQEDEDTSIKALRDIEEQQKKVREEIALLEMESLELDKEEERYWQECNEFQLALQNFHNERDSINLKYDYDSRQLEKLHKTNVYNDTFCIGHDGHFATINGFRLGRLPNQHVDWPEINAAWGQTLLLLHTIANKLNFTFKTYRLVPLGSFSRIDKVEGDRASYELYGSGEFGFGRMFLNRRFDNAMVAYLNCLQQLGDYAEQQGSKLELPYKINKDRIGDASIKLQFSQDEIWTKALKYTLTNTKWILAYASSSASSNMTSYTPSAPSLPISRRSSPAARNEPRP
ncbi:autophagy protein 6 [Podila epigama]|nr:autophagy protein 6 [Podila epigama]